MRAAIYTGRGEPLEITDVDRPTPSPDGVVIETDACGVCRSDWHAWQGDPVWANRRFEAGHVFGHEPVGTVVEVGSKVEQLRTGDHVTVPFNLGDGSCPRCLNGQSNVCENRRVLGLSPGIPGAFAESFHVPDADFNAVRLPDGVSSKEMAGMGCRFMTAFHALVHRADVDAGDWLAVHGCGGVGLSAIDIGTALGANVVAVDLFDEKLELATELGAIETVNASGETDVPAEIDAITNGGAHVSVDSLGIAETCRNSVDCLRTHGQHVQVGLTTREEGGEIALPTDRMVLKEIDWIGSVGMAPTRYDELFRMIEHGSVDPAAIISETITLDDLPETLASMTDYGTVGIPVIDTF